MNAIRRVLSRILFLGLLVVCVASMVVACKEEEAPTAQEQVTEKIVAAAAWSKPVVIVDGVDVSETYKDFTISFEREAYSTSGGAPMWAPSGKWVFANEKASQIILDDTVDVNIEVTDKQLVLERLWEFETFEPGRSRSVKGKHKFTLTNE
jgi:hypothetical protein